MKWREEGRGKSWVNVVWQTLHSQILVHRIELTQGLYRVGIQKKKSTSTAVNINIPSSSLSYSALKCHLFLHIAALFFKTVRAAACLEVKLAATHFSPQQASNGPGVLGHDNCLWPQRYFGLLALALGFQYMSLTMLMVVIVSLLSWDNDSKRPLQEIWDYIFDIHVFLVLLTFCTGDFWAPKNNM